jgi:hypothetical protein
MLRTGIKFSSSLVPGKKVWVAIVCVQVTTLCIYLFVDRFFVIVLCYKNEMTVRFRRVVREVTHNHHQVTRGQISAPRRPFRSRTLIAEDASVLTAFYSQ